MTLQETLEFIFPASAMTADHGLILWKKGWWLPQLQESH